MYKKYGHLLNIPTEFFLFFKIRPSQCLTPSIDDLLKKLCKTLYYSVVSYIFKINNLSLLPVDKPLPIRPLLLPQTADGI